MAEQQPIAGRAEMHQAFVEAMQTVQDKRAKEVGGHSWHKHLDRYGPRIYFSELAGIVSRIELLIWKQDFFELDNQGRIRLLDLLVDLGNYADFMYRWIGEWDLSHGVGLEVNRQGLIDAGVNPAE